MTNPLAGAAYLFRGLRLLNAPGVRRYVAIPLTINALVFGGLIWLAFGWGADFLTAQVDRLPEWLQWLDWLLYIVLGLALLLYGFSLSTFAANLLSAPFNGLLAEAVERRLGGTPPTGGGLLEAVKSVGPSIRDELRKLVYFLKWAVPFLVLFLIPGVNIIAAPLWLAFSAWMLALEYADFPMGNHNLDFATQRQRLRDQRLTALAFGGTVMTATLIPIVNFVIIPAAVAGATVFWRERIQGSSAETE